MRIREYRRTRFERAAERQHHSLVELEDARETIEKAIDSVEEYGYDPSIEEMDAVREQLERAKERAERVADAFGYEEHTNQRRTSSAPFCHCT